MVTLTYNACCRACLTLEGYESGYCIEDISLNNIQTEMEYDVVKRIEEWRMIGGNICHACGSSNVEITNIKADDYLLYNYDILVQRSKITKEIMYMFNIDKSNSILHSNDGGSIFPDIVFVEKCLFKICDIIKSIPNYKFTSHNKGNFFFCFTGTLKHMTNKYEINLERFRFNGISQAEIIDTIEELQSELRIMEM